MTFPPYLLHKVPLFFSKELDLTFILLDEWSLLTVEGMDSKKYLQGQLTCDLNYLKKDNFIISAHCNYAGKVFSNLFIFYHRNKIHYIIRQSILNKHLIEINKYTIFSNVKISCNNKAILLGIAGNKAEESLLKIFKKLPNKFTTVVQLGSTTIIYFCLPSPRFLLITNLYMMNFIKKKLKNKIKFSNSIQWKILDIEAGYPIIDLINSEKFFPQSINMEKLNGISFNKGCYIGQEIIARIKHIGNNKNSLYSLIGKSNSFPNTGENLEIKIKKEWKKSGTILASCRLYNNEILIQAILNNNFSLNKIRILYEKKNLLQLL